LIRVYVSPSIQEKNIGVNGYGSEEQQMQKIGDVVVQYLKAFPFLEVYRNNPDWTLAQVVEHSNNVKADYHIAIHSNAGPPSAAGTEVFYRAGDEKSKQLATFLYNEVAPLSPGKDRGIKADTVLYSSGLYELRHIKATGALIEVGFHTNKEEALWIMRETELIGNAIARGFIKMINPDALAKKENTWNAPEWKLQGMLWMYQNGYILEKHDPQEVVDFGILGTILQRVVNTGKGVK